MFILCPQCQFLVAIEPASGLPPERCPRCGHALRTAEPDTPPPPTVPTAPATQDAPVASPASDTTPVDAGELEVPVDPSATGVAEAVAELAVPTAPPATDAVSRPDASTTTPDVEPAPPRETPAKATRAGKAPKPEAVAHAGTDTLVAPGTTRRKRRTPEAPASPDASARLEPASGPARPAPVLVPSPDAGPHATPATPRPRAPSFARTRVPSVVGARPRWTTAALLAGLAVLLVLQVLLADRRHLAQDARWRPVLAATCSVLRCTLPAWHEPEAFVLVARDVRPTRPGVLHVTATFRNDARWTQAWPALHLALQDVDGRTIGARVFPPSDYLGTRPTQNGLAPGQVGSVAFDVAEPPGTVVAFTFDFR